MEDNLKELNKLIGKKIISVTQFDTGSFDDGIIIEFENKIYLTAQDGEYGCDAFRFLSKEEVDEIIIKTEKDSNFKLEMKYNKLKHAYKNLRASKNKTWNLNKLR